MDNSEFEGDIRPPELSSWALSLLQGERHASALQGHHHDRSDTATTQATTTLFSRELPSTQTHTGFSKANRFFTALNLGQASRLNEHGVYEPLQEMKNGSNNSTQLRTSILEENIKKRSAGTRTPIKSPSARKRAQQQDIQPLADLSIEIGRKSRIKETLEEIKVENVWSNKENNKDLMLQLNDSRRKTSLEPAFNSNSSSANKHIIPSVNQINTTNSKIITVNGKSYTVLEQIGKGGSSKVYKATSSKRSYAIKVVTFDDNDADEEQQMSTVNELKGEIQILRKLSDSSRVIQLIDHEINSESIKIVMELGEIDLAHVLQNRLKSHGFDEQFVRFHVNEMVQAIQQVHSKGIVHSDLKPANFIFVKGTLKLIDFGISNSINGATVNVYRECQMGTPNYMAPETLIEVANSNFQATDSNSVWRIGKPSDIWSIGCITYQLTYGRPPYHAYQGTKKILAITNPRISIEYPTEGPNGERIPDTLIQFMKRCLIRNPKNRITVDELLQSGFLNPISLSRGVLRDIVKWSVVYGGKHPEIGLGLNGTKGKQKSDLSDNEIKSLNKLDTLVENLIMKVNRH